MDKPQQTVVIVGGVAGGASAATRARRLSESARIVLFEKDENVSFANCGMPYHIGGEITDREKLVVAKPELLRDRFGIEVRTRCEVMAIHRETKEVEVLDHASGETFRQSYDKLILAPGAAPLVPPIPGLPAPNALILRNLADMDRIKERVDAMALEGKGRVVVVGAGFIGLEMAEQLHHRGLQVSLVELQDQVLPPLDKEMADLVATSVREAGIDLRLGSGLQGFETKDGSIEAIALSDGSKIACDLVVLGLGVRPQTRLAEGAGLALGPTRGIAVDGFSRTNDPDIYAVGDAAESVHGVTDAITRIPLAGSANRAGRLAAEHAVTGTSRSAPKVQGTAIVRAFGKVAAMTGLSSKAATAQGVTFRSVMLEARNHASYYPGAEPMVLKVVYDPADGRVLGAQAVGGNGVDKRIDILSTVIHFKGTVEDLTELDLTYAPPFGSAKDAVHMAGFLATNQQDGLVEFLATDADLEGWQVLDVRTPAEVARDGAPAGSLAIPVDQLRERANEIDASRPTAIVCRSGQRAWLASRILTQRGQRNAVVSGGWLVRGRAK